MGEKQRQEGSEGGISSMFLHARGHISPVRSYEVNGVACGSHSPFSPACTCPRDFMLATAPLTASEPPAGVSRGRLPLAAPAHLLAQGLPLTTLPPQSPRRYGRPSTLPSIDFIGMRERGVLCKDRHTCVVGVARVGWVGTRGRWRGTEAIPAPRAQIQLLMSGPRSGGHGLRRGPSCMWVGEFRRTADHLRAGGA